MNPTTSKRIDCSTMKKLMTTFFLFYLSLVHATIPGDLEPINIYGSEDTKAYSVFLDADESNSKLHDFQGMKKIGSYYYVYARDFVFVIDLSNQSPNAGSFHSKQDVSWSSDETSVSLCRQKGQDQEKCASFIKIFEEIAANEDEGATKRMFVCSTNAFNPSCRYYEVSTSGQLTRTNSEVAGTLICPYDPSNNVASIVSDGDLYTGTQAGFSGHDSLMLRSSLTGSNSLKNLRTPRGDTSWLNDPNFLRFLDGGRSLNKVYGFFTEATVEDKSLQVYTRIVQTCKNDLGGRTLLRNQFSSFFKVRLNCSFPGQPPFYFNEMRDVTELLTLNSWYKVGNTKMIFAIMNTPSNSIPASAVCIFTQPDIEKSLSGSFKEKYIGEKSRVPYWDEQDNYPTPHLSSCDNDPRQLSDMNLNFVRKHPIMHDSVPAWNLIDNITRGHDAMPVFSRTKAGNFLTAIAVDTQAGTPSMYTVLIVGTQDGKIIKVLLMDTGSSLVIEERVVFNKDKCGDNDTSVRAISLDKESGTMLVAFNNCMIRAPLCPIKSSCGRKCIQSRDPYCGWDGNRCVTVDQLYSNNNTAHGDSQPRQDVIDGNVEGMPDCDDPVLLPKSSGATGGTPEPAFDGGINITTGQPSNDTIPPPVLLPLAAASPYMIPLLVGVGCLIVGFFFGIVCCIFKRKYCTAKEYEDEKLEAKMAKGSLSNGHAVRDVRRDSNQSNNRQPSKSRQASTSSHHNTSRHSNPRGSMHEDSRRRRTVTETSVGNRSDDGAVFGDAHTPDTPSARDVPDSSRVKQIQSTSSSVGGRRRTRNSKPSTSSGPENGLDDPQGSPQKRNPPMPIGEGHLGYDEAFAPDGNFERQGSNDSGHSSEGLTTLPDAEVITTNAPSSHKMRAPPHRSMSFQDHHTHMQRAYTLDNSGASTMGHGRPHVRQITRQHSLQVADTMPKQMHHQQRFYPQTMSPQVQPPNNMVWANQPQMMPPNSTPSKGGMDNRRMASMTHSLDRRKMLKGQTQYQLPPNESFEEPPLMGPPNNHPTRKRYLSESEKNARVTMSRPTQYQPIHEEQEPLLHTIDNGSPVKDPKALRNNLYLNLAPALEAPVNGFGSHSAPIMPPHQMDASGMGPPTRLQYPRRMIPHSNPGTPLREMPPSFVDHGHSVFMSPTGRTNQQRPPFVPHQQPLPEEVRQKLMGLTELKGSPTKSNPSSPISERPPSFPSSDRRRHCSGQLNALQPTPSPVKTTAPVSFGTSYPQVTMPQRTRHVSGGNGHVSNGVSPEYEEVQIKKVVQNSLPAAPSQFA